MKRYVWIFVVIALPYCKNKEQTTQPVRQDITESVYASGKVKSKNQYEVFSSANGILQQVMVKKGSLVRKGDVLIRLVNTTQKLNTENAQLSAAYLSVGANVDKLNEAKIAIQVAKTKLQNDSILLERQKNLWNSEIGSRTELEQRELAYKNSRDAFQTSVLRYNQLLQQLQYTSEQAKKNLKINTAISGDYSIRARDDGRVYDILKEPGEIVTTQTPVALLGDANEFILELQVDEYDIAKIKLGQKVLLTMDSYKGQVFNATVSNVIPTMDERSRSFTVEASFVKQPVNLYPNLTVEANILINTKKNAITIPRDYLLDDNYVMLKNGEKRKVEVGLKDFQRAEIISGLSKDNIIKKPAQ